MVDHDVNIRPNPTGCRGAYSAEATAFVESSKHLAGVYPDPGAVKQVKDTSPL